MVVLLPDFSESNAYSDSYSDSYYDSYSDSYLVKLAKTEMPVYVVGGRLLSRRWTPGVSGLASKWVRFAPNETNP